MFWDNVAWVYDIFVNVINRRTHQQLKQIIAELINRNDNVLECACGTGMLTEVMAQKCMHVTATDYAEKMLKRAEKNCRAYSNLTFEPADITKLPYPDNTFDKVVAGNVIHLLDEPLKALRELNRVCRSGGTLIIPTYMNKAESGKDSGFSRAVGKAGADFKRQFTSRTYKQFFLDAGYTDVQIYEVQGVDHVDLMYGVSLGGATVVRFLAAESIPVTKAVIDAGITPYPYPKAVCRLIAAGDFLSVSLATKNRTVMELIAPPNRWTPAGENPTDHYDRIFDFEKNHYFYRTLYNSFWSANNYAMPDPVPAVDTYIEYWYGEGEKHARAKNCAYVKRVYPQTVSREFRGLMHAELVLMYPKLFREEILRVWNQKRRI